MQTPERCHILVVDDDKEDQEIITDYFNEAGIVESVSFLENGQMAIDFLEEMHQKKAELPKLVILDLNMPILNGTQTLRMLKTDDRYKDIPVIIFSTSINEIEKERCLKYGAEKYLVKPMTYKEGQNIMKIFSSFLTNHTL